MSLKTLARSLLGPPLQAWRKRRSAALQRVARRQRDAGDHEAALATLKRAANLDSRNASLRGSMAIVLIERGLIDAALDHLRIGHVLEPDNGEVLDLLAQTLIHIGRLQKAQAVCEAALRRDRRYFEPWACLGLIHLKMGRDTDALACYSEAVALRPDHAESITNRAVALHNLGHLDDALAGYEAALALAPATPLARFKRAEVLLAKGDYAQGWPEYETRLALRDHEERAPRWNGSPLPGHSILVRAEPRIELEILFASCLPQVLANAGRCTVECSPALGPLFARSFPHASVRPVGAGQSTRAHDYEISIGSLPLHYRRSVREFPKQAGYLVADEIRTQDWREQLRDVGPGMKIGITWRGDAAAHKAIALDEWSRVFAVRGVRFVSLETADSAAADIAELERNGGPPIAHWPHALDDIDETAALVAALDLIISISAPVVHVAGALARPLWILTPEAPEWCYGSRGEAMPWYPSARVFRYEDSGDWERLLRRVAGELHALQQYSFGGVAVKPAPRF
jgi:tetratricopeptide (TPR) repeat protein